MPTTRSPIEDITVEELAHLIYWEGWIDKETSERIAKDSSTLAEVLVAARREGVILSQLPYIETIQAVSSREELERTPPGELATRRADLTEERTTTAVEVGQAVVDAVENNVPVLEALDAIGVTTDEEEEPMSSLIFPEGFGSGIDDAAHIKMVTSDDYSPWGPDQTREEMSNHMNTMIFKDIVASRGKEHSEGINYWKNQYRQPGGYVAGQEVLAWAGLSTQTRVRLEDKMVNAGLLDPDGGYVPGSMGMPQLQAMRAMMGVGNLKGIGYEPALNGMVGDYQAFLRAEERRASRARRGSGAGRAPFVVPASLREIPDYESLAQDARNRFRQRMGRDPEEWEEAILADHLGARHRESNAEKIKAARAAFYAAQGGGQGVMEVEVPNPELRNQRFIEERYGPEIDRQERIEDQAVTNKMLIDAITMGSQMVGGA